MKCLRKYKWVKLPRMHLPGGKGLMGYWAKLASRAAFRKGNAVYCGHINPVTAGMWSGGVVGLKSILSVKKRVKALWIMNQLQDLGYISYSLDPKTKQLTYQINDWVLKCSGAECKDGAVYATEGYGFLCMPRNITERLVGKRTFEEADAWLDLWCHTTYGDYGNAFSFLGPAIQYGKYGSVLTLDGLGKRWGWEKTKVWRFFKKHEDTYALFRLPGAYGCVIFNRIYPAASEIPMPEHEDVIKVLNDIRKAGKKISVRGSDSERLNCMIAWRSRIVVTAYEKEMEDEAKTGVALSIPLIRAYFSHGRNCKNCRNCIYDCQGMSKGFRRNFEQGHDIRGPCALESPFRLFTIAQARDTPRIALAPSRLLFGVPSKSIMV